MAKITGTDRHYFHKDHLQSSTVMSNQNGTQVEATEYLPFGSMRVHTGLTVTDYKFTDQELDTSTNLYNYDARLYDPVIGRFISPDSIVPDYYNPQSLNRYSYCLNNPLIYVDPSGHIRISFTGISVGVGIHGEVSTQTGPKPGPTITIEPSLVGGYFSVTKDISEDEKAKYHGVGKWAGDVTKTDN